MRNYLPVTNDWIWRSLVPVSTTLLFTAPTIITQTWKYFRICLSDAWYLVVESKGKTDRLWSWRHVAVCWWCSFLKPLDGGCQWIAAADWSRLNQSADLDQSEHSIWPRSYLQITSWVRSTRCISGFLIWLLPSYSTTCLVAESINLTKMSCSWRTPEDENIFIKTISLKTIWLTIRVEELKLVFDSIVGVLPGLLILNK